MTEPRASALILAAGGGTRMGGPKALLEFEGRLLVERAVETALAGGCKQVTVVLGAQADEVRRRAALTSAHVVVNEAWAEGMGSSLRTGLAALDENSPIDEVAAPVPDPFTPETPPNESSTAAEFDAALILLVDQPFIGPPAVRAVLDAWRGGARLVSAAYAGKRGHPVLIGREHWPEAARSATGDSGARSFLAAHAAELVLVPCDALADPRDLDTPQDLL
jgi:CTP:molybdopterin cytidylyltransferase MocA